jgi:hypothetical protein
VWPRDAFPEATLLLEAIRGLEASGQRPGQSGLLCSVYAAPHAEALMLADFGALSSQGQLGRRSGCFA